MVMMDKIEKMQNKSKTKSKKKGFTLVELVIVIAILAILAAIAIPVITTTINSAKLSTLESDTASLNMLVCEAINTSKASITYTLYGSSNLPAARATVGDVCYSNDLECDSAFFTRWIGGSEYKIVFTSAHHVEVQGGKYTATGMLLSSETKISSLDPEKRT